MEDFKTKLREFIIFVNLQIILYVNKQKEYNLHEKSYFLFSQFVVFFERNIGTVDKS